MKIAPKVNLNQGEKLSGAKPPAETLRPKAGKSRKSVYSRDRASLIREQDEKSGRKLGIIGEAKKPQAARPKKNWTVLYYGSFDDIQEQSFMRDILGMQAVSSDHNINILAQVDRGAKFHTVKQYGGKPGATRYYLTKQENVYSLTSREIEHFGQVNASNPKHLENFLTWGMKNYPARHYLVIASGHGGGIAGTLYDDCPEAEKEHHDKMTLPELDSAVKKAENAAGVNKEQVIIQLCSCLMGQTETAYELKDSASLLIASQSTVHTDDNLSYLPFLARGAGDFNLREMGGQIFKSNAEQIGSKEPLGTSALVDLKQMPSVKKAVIEFEKAVKDSPASKEILKAIMEVKSRPNFHYDTPVSFYASDFVTLASSIAKNRQLKDPKLKAAAKNLNAALDKAIAEFSRREDLDEYNKNASGLGITTASEPGFYKETGYQELAFDKDTGWSKFMTSYASGVELGEKNGLLETVFELPVKHKEIEKGDNTFFIKKQDQTALVADAWLKNKAGLKKEVALARQRIEELNKYDLTPLEKEKKSFNILFGVHPFCEFRYASSTMPSLEAVKSVVLQAVNNQEFMSDVIKTGLLVLSALKGEISAETIAQGARNLLESKEHIKPRIRYRFGSELLSTLAAMTRNDRVIAALNQGGLNPEKQLKAVADLGKGKRSEA